MGIRRGLRKKHGEFSGYEQGLILYQSATISLEILYQIYGAFSLIYVHVFSNSSTVIFLRWIMDKGLKSEIHFSKPSLPTTSSKDL
jgi:hypothetical protein